MAISFVGAGIIWRFVYNARDTAQDQTGVLNSIWVALGQLSNSGWPKVLAALILAGIIAGLLYLVLGALAQFFRADVSVAEVAAFSERNRLVHGFNGFLDALTHSGDPVEVPRQIPQADVLPFTSARKPVQE